MSKHVIFKIITIWFLLTQTLPFFNRYIPIPQVWSITMFVALSAFLFPKLLGKRSMLALLAYIVIAFFYFLAGNSFFDRIGTVTGPLLGMASCILIFEYALKYDADYKFSRLVVYVVVISDLIMALISIPEVLAFPNIIRTAFNVNTKERVGGLFYWLITYETCHGLAFLFAPMAFLCRRAFRKNKKLFIFWLFSIVVLLYIVYLSNATTPLIFSVIMLTLGFLIRNERFSRNSVLALVVVGLMGFAFTSKTIMIPILDVIQEQMDETWANYHKIEDFRRELLTGEAEGDIAGRQQLYTNSIELFVEHPITGTDSPEKISYHSWFIDRLACFGIILFIPIVLIFVYTIKPAYNNLKHTRVVYIMGAVTWLLMLFVKNDFGQGSWLYGFAVLPLLCRYIDSLINNKLIKTAVK